MPFDFTLLFSNLLVGASLVLGFIGWLTAFIGQAIIEGSYDGRGSAVGVQWFGIFLEAALLVSIIYIVATGLLGVHRFQLGIWSGIALVFAVNGVNAGIYGLLVKESASRAMGAGYLLLTFVNIFWVFFFTCDESSALFHTINGFSNGPALMPRRSGRGTPGQLRRSSSAQHMNGGPMSNSHSEVYNTSNGMIQTNTYNGGLGAKDRASHGSLHSTGSFQGQGIGNRAMSPIGGQNSIRSPGGQLGPQGEPLMGMGGIPPTSSAPIAKARALYAYQASADDPNEISFSKGEILEVLDQSGKWWQSRRADGTVGIVPSNYLSLLESA